MRRHHVGDVIVIGVQQQEQRVPIGIITDRDILVETIALDIEARLFTASDLMSTPLTATMPPNRFSRPLPSSFAAFTKAPTSGRNPGSCAFVSVDDSGIRPCGRIRKMRIKQFDK